MPQMLWLCAFSILCNIVPLKAYHIIICPLLWAPEALPEALANKSSLKGCHATTVTASSWPSKQLNSESVLRTSYILIFESLLAVKNQFPFTGFHLTWFTMLLWAGIVCTPFPPARGSQSFTYESLLPVRTKLSKGCQSQLLTSDLWSLKQSSSLLVAKSNTRAVLSSAQDRSLRLELEKERSRMQVLLWAWN